MITKFVNCVPIYKIINLRHAGIVIDANWRPAFEHERFNIPNANEVVTIIPNNTETEPR